MEWNREKGIEALNQLQKRASCRSFSEKDIPEDDLKAILETGLRAATGGNLQPYSIIVVKDAEKRKKLAKLNFDQEFIAKAPVSLVFVLDWYKNGRLAEIQRAPYTAPDSYMHYLIGVEDVMCAAQVIESAAWLMGLGSVYIGTTNSCGGEMSELLELPKHTYPIVMLTLGYPKHELAKRGRLPYEFSVFDETYKSLSDEEVEAAFLHKHGTLDRDLSKVEAIRKETLNTMREALLTTYSEVETEDIIAEMIRTGKYKEYHYRFGLHYNAKEVLEEGGTVLDMMDKQELRPFSVKLK